MEFELKVRLNDDVVVTTTYDPNDKRQIEAIAAGISEASIALGINVGTVHTVEIDGTSYEIFFAPNGDKVVKVHQYVDEQLDEVYTDAEAISYVLDKITEAASASVMADL